MTFLNPFIFFYFSIFPFFLSRIFFQSDDLFICRLSAETVDKSLSFNPEYEDEENEEKGEEWNIRIVRKPILTDILDSRISFLPFVLLYSA